MPAVPPIEWAERPDILLVTIKLTDMKDAQVVFTEKNMTFTAKHADKDYACTVDFKKEINPEESTYSALARGCEMKIKKKEEGPYWEGLSATKMRNVKVDWNKWKDEDEVDGEEDLGDFGMGGMPGMGGMGGMPGMGGMGMPGMGGMDFGGMDGGFPMGDDGDSDDEGEEEGAEEPTENKVDDAADVHPARGEAAADAAPVEVTAAP